MKTRSSSKFIGEPSTNPTSTNPKRRNRRRSKQRVEPFVLEEVPVVTMADQRTIEELLRAPTEGYAEAIVVPPIPAEHFELKHSLINLVTWKQFCSFEDPHAHIRYFNKITSTLMYKDVPETSIKLLLFPFSIDGPARIWLDKEPPRSILTWDDLVSKFINHFFPPSKTTRSPSCPHHGFTELHQLDTVYNGLNPSDQDSLNSAAGGNLLERSAQDVLKIIENKSKVRHSRNKPIVSQVKASNVDSSEMAKLTDAVTQVTSVVATMMKQFQAPAPASVKAVEESCVTCGGAHSYRQCPATDGNTFTGYHDNIQGYVSAAAVNNNYNQGYRPQGDPHFRASNQMGPPGFPSVQNNQNRFNQNQGYNQNQGNNQGNYQNRGSNLNQGNNQNQVFNQNQGRGNNFNQAPTYQAPTHQPQVVGQSDFQAYMKANDAIMKNMQTQMTSLTNSNIELKSMFGQFMKMNTASSSGSGSLPSNTIPNPREDLKAITTQSGATLAGPSVPPPPPSPSKENRSRRGINNGIRACALRNFNLEVMELENSQNNALAKLPMLKLGEYEMWEIRIKQYFQIQDYALWEMTVPSTAEEKICKKNDVKARSLLLMALPNEHQLTFNQKVKRTIAANNDDKNLAFLTTSSPSSTNTINTVNTGVSTGTTKVNIASTETSTARLEISTLMEAKLLDMINQRYNVSTAIKWDILLENAEHQGVKITEIGIKMVLDLIRVTRQKMNSSKHCSSSAFTDSEVLIDKSCSKSCLNNYEALKKQYDDLLVKLDDTGFKASTYKRGLSILEAYVVKYKESEVKEEKEGFEFKIAKFEKSSKDLDDLLASQVTDKSKKGFGYNDVPSPHPLILNRPTPLDLSYSGLEEFKQPEENTDDSLKQQHKTVTETSSVKSPLNCPKHMVPRAVLMKTGLKTINNARPVNTVSNSQLNDKGFVDSGCSRYMFGNIAHLLDFKDFDGGYVTFGGGANGGRITGKAERKNRTLNEAARTMLADSKLPTTFWAEAIYTACYVNRKDKLGKFDGKSDEGFFVGYSLSSKAFRNKPMIEGNGPKWLFDLDSLTQSMNYVPVVAGTFSNDFAGIQGVSESSTSSQQDQDNQDCIVMPIWKDASYFDDASPRSVADAQLQDQNGTHDDCSLQNNGTADQQVNTASPEVNTGSRVVSTAVPEVNTATPEDLMGPIPTSEDTQVEDQEIELGNLSPSYAVPTTPQTRVHKDHPIDHVIGDV
ncbi:reverse transcriptase domain-containing protein [Tanacetum coccineum]